MQGTSYRNGFKDATTDPAVIRARWARCADLNVAIATGAPGPDVLDVDVHQDGADWPAFDHLKRAGMLAGARALVRTPSGGLHVHFAGTRQDCGRLARHHLDFKATGGYVLAPPSVVHGKPYELLDHRAATSRLDWQAVRRVLDPPAAAPAPRRPGGGSPAALVTWVAGLGEGNRNAGLYWAACRAAGDGDVLGQLVVAAVQAGLPEDEARRTVASAARRAAG
jgi:Bifunctional DNA primase/polymerase, N-terminal